jgi:hypothetical protein
VPYANFLSWSIAISHQPSAISHQLPSEHPEFQLLAVGQLMADGRWLIAGDH